MSATERPRPVAPTVDRPIAVVGATGEQGGAVARALLSQGVPVRAVVRDPHAGRARALVDLGAMVARADLEDEASLRAAFSDVAGVYAMAAPTADEGAAGEARHGAAMADAAAAVGVPHVVYSSVGGADRHTGIPHFESKRRIEERLLEIGVPTTFVRPRMVRPASGLPGRLRRDAGPRSSGAHLRGLAAGERLAPRLGKARTSRRAAGGLIALG